MEYNFVKFPK